VSKRRRSLLRPEEARQRYIRAAETVLLEQIQLDAGRLDREDDELRVAVGPFAKLNAEQVAASADGKSRGAITNLFKSQRQFQLQAMALVLEDPEVDVFAPPDPTGFDDPIEWIEAVASAESARGPMHEMEPKVGYGMSWTLWLSQVPYGVWSEHIAQPSMHEFRHSAERLEAGTVRPALAHFSQEVRPPWTAQDLATAMNSLREGLWLNQCLSREHPSRAGTPVAQAARDALRMLWQGATQPAARSGETDLETRVQS
jgi:AcrR family transcriptional regulator